jgi:hypothetical protein
VTEVYLKGGEVDTRSRPIQAMKVPKIYFPDSFCEILFLFLSCDTFFLESMHAHGVNLHFLETSYQTSSQHLLKGTTFKCDHDFHSVNTNILSIFFLLPSATGDWTQGLALYHLSHAPSPSFLSLLGHFLPLNINTYKNSNMWNQWKEPVFY